MSITPGKAIILTGLAALALAACGEGTTSVSSETSAGANIAGEGGTLGAGGTVAESGAGGSGGQGGAMEVKDVEPFDWCWEETIDATISKSQDEKLYFHYDPSDVTLPAGSVVLFQQVTDVQATISGVYPDADGKFASEPGGALCLIFNKPGTYPYWSDGVHFMTGTIHIQ